MRQEKATDIKERFGKAIRQRRRELDLSQEQLAERAGLHRTYISSVERGTQNPSLENIEKLAGALEISIADLFTKYGIEIKD
ncbi:helix-turn-helix domain-containing protein [Phormidesmis priestleyi]